MAPQSIRILIITLVSTMHLAFGQVFTDNFDRPDSDDINASNDGMAGSVAPLEYLVRQAVISSGQLFLTGGTGHAVPDHDFVDAELAQGFRIRFSVNPIVGGNGTRNQWAAISIGHSSLEAASEGNFRVINGDSIFGLLLRERGAFQSFRDSAVVTDNPIFDADPTSADKTYQVDIEVSQESFEAGSVATVRVRIDGVIQPIGDGGSDELTVTWAGSNYINFETNGGPEGALFDDLEILPNVPSGISLTESKVPATAAEGTEIGTLLADGGKAPFRFELVAGEGDAANDLFQVEEERLLVNGSLADAGEALSIRVRVTDANEAVFENSLTISISGDVDGDDLPDAWEDLFAPGDLTVLSGLDGADSDADGLTDLDEFNRNPEGTTALSPVKADSDDDGSNDGEEITRMTDPLIADTDGDGLLDGAERETNPLLSDTDGDGLTDGEEVTTDPALADTDGDGASDGVEVGFGTDPNDAASRPNGGVFSDTFNRPDSDDINDSAGGSLGTLAPLGYVATGAAIENGRLRVSGGTGYAVPNHNFTDAALAKGFRIRFEMNPIVNGAGNTNPWGAISFGHSSLEAASEGNFRIVNSDSVFGLLLRDNGTFQSFRDSVVVTNNPTFDDDPTSADKTYQVDIEVRQDGFASGTEATVRVRVDGVFLPIGEGETEEMVITWGDANFINLETNGGGDGSTFDNFQVLPNTPLSIALTGVGISATANDGFEAGTLSTDGGTGPYTYTIMTGDGDGDNDRFRIEGDKLIVASSLSGATGQTLSVRLRTTDANDASLEQVLMLEVAGDFDSDGLPDFWEELFAPGDLAALSGQGGADADDDGLTDLDEFNRNADGTNGLSPLNADSDEDGSNDGEEITRGTDPLLADTDGDGLLDGAETDTDPLLADTDGDGLSDSEELAASTDPNNRDSDGDGFSDAVELGLASNPNNPASVPDVGFFADTFDRPNSEDINAERGGVSASFDFTGYTAKNAEIVDGKLQLSGGTGWIVPDHDFTDDELAEGFTISFEVNPVVGGGGTANQWGAISFGHSQEAAAEGNFRVINGDSIFGLLVRDRGAFQSFVDNAVITDDPVFDPNAAGNDKTYQVEIEVETLGFGEGNEALIRARVNGQLLMIADEGTSTDLILPWRGVNFINLETNATSLFDNFLIRPSFAATGEPPVITSITRTSESNAVEIAWQSQEGVTYIVERSTDLIDWTILNSELPATGALTLFPDENDTPEAFYRLAASAPPALFSTSFEDGDEGWEVITGDGDTEWELGAPTAGPDAARTGEAVWGTDLDSTYASGVVTSLRSPMIDVSSSNRVSIEFHYFIDTPQDLEGGIAKLIDENGDEIATPPFVNASGEPVIFSGTSNDWARLRGSINLANLREARDIDLNQIRIQFDFLSDGNDDDNGAGWYIDDFEVRNRD